MSGIHPCALLREEPDNSSLVFLLDLLLVSMDLELSELVWFAPVERECLKLLVGNQLLFHLSRFIKRKEVIFKKNNYKEYQNLVQAREEAFFVQFSAVASKKYLNTEVLI